MVKLTKEIQMKIFNMIRRGEKFLIRKTKKINYVKKENNKKYKKKM